MVGTVILAVLWIVSGLCFNWFVRRVTADTTAFKSRIAALEKRVSSTEQGNDANIKIGLNTAADVEDHEARIAFCEGQLTAKTSSPKIVAKAHKVNFRQFAEAASKASEDAEDVA